MIKFALGFGAGVVLCSYLVGRGLRTGRIIDGYKVDPLESYASGYRQN